MGLDQIAAEQDVDAVGRALPVRRMRRQVAAACPLVQADQLFGLLAIAGMELLQQFLGFFLARDQEIAAPGHVDAVVAAARDLLHQVRGMVGEVGHRRMRPPVAVVLAGLRRGQRHRLAFVDNQHAQTLVLNGEVIGRGDADDSRTDHQDFDVIGLHAHSPAAA
ncbi:hypothetical protein ACVJH7_004870 [Bradyrhizobium elkanii]